jgi:glycosyltransferase involved in cell wall biosynthesis
MRVGILAPDLRRSGGIFQYTLSLIDALEDERAAGRLEAPVLIHGLPTELPLERLQACGWSVQAMPRFASRGSALLDPLRRVVGEGRLRQAWRGARGRVQAGIPAPAALDRLTPRPEVGDWLRGLGVELMVYPYPTPLAFEAGVPYVFVVHDLQHRLQPEFPEVSANGEWERREHVYRNATRNAVLVLTDSETGKEDVLACYGDLGVTADRVFVLPSVPAEPPRNVPDAERRRVRERHRLPARYLFYPAQFWPHKNHVRLVEALGVLRARGLAPDLVLAGGSGDPVRNETHAAMQAAADATGVRAQVHELGYVRDEDMPGLYAEAVALVMPTFFGPTNIPPLEAWAFGCPVLTSNVRGLPEQAGDAAVLVDPRSVEDVARGIELLWTDEALRRDLVERGRRRLLELRPEDHGARVRAMLDVAAAKL